jgi:hypothetical protein
MSDFTEFRLRIAGDHRQFRDNTGDDPAGPVYSNICETMAAIMGHRTTVHFMRMEEGSAMPIFYVDRDEGSGFPLVFNWPKGGFRRKIRT